MDGLHRPESESSTQFWLLLGAAGAGMRALSEILGDLKISLRGTDQRFSTPSDIEDFRSGCPGYPGVLLTCGASRDVLLSGVTHVAVSPAVPSDDDCLVAARRRGIPVFSLVEAVQNLTESSYRVCVAGTHGKSTTTAMIWWVAKHWMDQGSTSSPQVPGLYCGGELIGLGRHGVCCAIAHDEGKRVSVIESCEYRRSFLKLSPDIAVLTGVDRDHFDCFPSESEEQRAFEGFLSRVSRSGAVIVNSDCPRAIEAALASDRRLVRVGWGSEADVRGSMLGNASGCLRVGVRHRTADLGEIEISIPGRHNAINAMFAVAACLELGIPFSVIRSGIRGFPGVRRRFERTGGWQGLTWIDDYAHHPDAVRVTLETAKLVYPGKRLVAVFEPHQMSRTQVFSSQFADALAIADEILLLPVLAARESASWMDCCRQSGEIVSSLNQRGRRAFLLANLDQVIGRIDHSARPGDVVVTMGAGRTNQIHDEYHRRVFRDSAA
ncbi:MAG: hypothetical protein JNL58_23775 [Planctomyces sp.]|nr:hypothetical protein [Planctomyces sp.]